MKKTNITITPEKAKRLEPLYAEVELKDFKNGVFEVIITIPFYNDDEGRDAKDLFKDLTK